VNQGAAGPVVLSELTDQQAREFVEALAVPEHADPPPCPLCGRRHPLESKCPSADPERDDHLTASRGSTTGTPSSSAETS
jgi:hypothetical protein